MSAPAGHTEASRDPPTMLEADDHADEAYATGDESTFSASVTSSIRAYRQENGRRYHAYKDGSYMMPNDDIENDRLDFQHAMFQRTLDGKLHLAPIPQDVQHVLDVGTGTGVWAIDFADEYPSAKVIGTDLSPIQPGMVPPNLQFYVEDAESDWTYDHKFDYIHGRMLIGSFNDYLRFFKQCFDNLKPGGYIEMQDIGVEIEADDDTAPPNSALVKWSNLLIEAFAKFGRPCHITREYKKLMEEAGFVDVVEVVHKWPINDWPKDPKHKELGTWQYHNVMEGMQGFSMAPLTRALGWSASEVELFLVDVRKDLKNRKIHAYSPIYFVYGRKPEN